MATDPPVTVRFPDRYTCSVFGPDSWAAPPLTANAVAFPRRRLRPAKFHAPPVTVTPFSQAFPLWVTVPPLTVVSPPVVRFPLNASVPAELFTWLTMLVRLLVNVWVPVPAWVRTKVEPLVV